MELPFGNPDLRTMYEETMSSIKRRLPRCPNAGADLEDRINTVSKEVNSLANNTVEQTKLIEDNLYWLSKLNYQLKRLVA